MSKKRTITSPTGNLVFQRLKLKIVISHINRVENIEEDTSVKTFMSKQYKNQFKAYAEK